MESHSILCDYRAMGWWTGASSTRSTDWTGSAKRMVVLFGLKAWEVDISVLPVSYSREKN